MKSARRRLLVFLAGAPVTLVVLAWSYMLAMAQFEGEARDFWASLEWAAETMTTTGYGADDSWHHPLMIMFVVVTQFLGVALTFVAFSLVVVPYFEARFEGRLPRVAPRIREDYVLVYRYGAAVASLIPELQRAKVPTLVLEEDEAQARRLLDRGENVVFAKLDVEDADQSVLRRARAILANGTDEQNGALILWARHHGYAGEIIAFAERPLHRKPMMLAGATAVYTPLHILASAIAAHASERARPPVLGIGRLGGKLRSTEIRVDHSSVLAGKTLAQADIRAKTGATIIGQWRGGEFGPHPVASDTLVPGTILVAVGSQGAIDRLGKLATPLKREGPFVICGCGEVGSKLVELFTDAGEAVVVIDTVERPEVQIVGDALDQTVLKQADVKNARAVILVLGDDTTNLFATAVVRDYATDVPIIARVDRPENIERVHRAGADFALSLGDVAARMLAQRMLGAEWISVDAHIKLVRVHAAGLAGKNPTAARVGAQTGCAIVAVERDGEPILDLPGDLEISADDDLYICGLESDVERYYEVFPASRIS